MQIRPISVGNILNHKRSDKLANMLSHHVRFITGIGTICCEPAVDYWSNRKQSKGEQQYSLVKTIIKIVVGTASGVTARYIGYKLGKKYVQKQLAPLIKKMYEHLEFNDVRNKIIRRYNKALEIVKTAKDNNKILDRFRKETWPNSKYKDLKSYKEIEAHLSSIDTLTEQINKDPSGNKIKKIIAKRDKLVEAFDDVLISKLPINDRFKKDFLPHHNKFCDKFIGEYVISKGSESGKLNKYAMAFGDVIGIAATCTLTMTTDIPLLNGTMNYVMGKFYPQYTAKGGKNESK